MNSYRQIWKIFLLSLWLVTQGAVQAETLVNWELGFEVDVPDTWLRRELGEQGLKLNADEVRMQVEPYSGITQDEQIKRLHKLTKEDEKYDFIRFYTIS